MHHRTETRHRHPIHSVLTYFERPLLALADDQACCFCRDSRVPLEVAASQVDTDAAESRVDSERVNSDFHIKRYQTFGHESVQHH